ncbi:DUF1778 domain-containing protein [Candidatus Sororendozoicomonas aggregata]|uniref:type II toxin-antitoxin system TacA family antitoxin n=1 Tax=Candidatus Sororendozoicomonas aggregata TaxID=3073239 RepID=UPI002ED3572A
MATARLDLRLNEEIKAKAEKASALLGLKSLTEYVVHLMDQDATRVIAEHESMVVEDDVFDRFTTACQQVKQPNKKLKDALRLTREQGIQ